MRDGKRSDDDTRGEKDRSLSELRRHSGEEDDITFYFFCSIIIRGAKRQCI